MMYRFLQPKSITFRVPSNLNELNRDDYRNVYSDFLFADDGYSRPHFKNEAEALEKIWMVFNTEKRPHGYDGRSMSVGDIVELDNGPDDRKAYICNVFGWTEVRFK